MCIRDRYAYDFKANALKLKDGKTYLVEGNEALQIWIYKALLTPRFRHVAYTKAYGSEIHTLLGHCLLYTSSYGPRPDR